MRFKPLSSYSAQAQAIVEETRLAIYGPILLLLLATAAWAASLASIGVRQTSDLGLVAVFPPSIYIALLILTIGYCLTLYHRDFRVPVLLLQIVVLILILYGTPTLIEDVPHGHVPWRHVGFTEYIMRNGAVNGRLETYFNWPGFFILSAFLTQVAGFASPLSLTAWAPVYFNLLYLGPLVTILRSATTDRRVVWLAVWFFYLANWVGQDYFVPQALGYFFYLVILAILLRWFKISSRRYGAASRWVQHISRIIPRAWLASSPPPDVPSAPSQPWQRVGLMALVLLSFAAVVASHPLTPFLIVISVGALVLFNRVTPRGLPVLMAVVALTWLSYMTVAFLAGHMYKVIGDIGDVSQNVNASVGQRVRGSLDHIFVVRVRLLITGLVGVLALLGAVMRVRQGYRDVTLMLLAAVPFTLLVLQSYGGEAMLRAYMAALPFMAFFAASLFFARLSFQPSRRAIAAIGMVSVMLVGCFMIARYGNERMDNFSDQEAQAIDHLYTVAEPKSLFVAASVNLPWKARDYEFYRYTTISRFIRRNQFDNILKLMENEQYTASYLILTRSQREALEFFAGWQPETWDDFEEQVQASGRFTLVYANDDAQIYVLNPGTNNTVAGGVPNTAHEVRVRKEQMR